MAKWQQENIDLQCNYEEQNGAVQSVESAITLQA